jgi:hypothetical protein
LNTSTGGAVVHVVIGEYSRSVSDPHFGHGGKTCDWAIGRRSLKMNPQSSFKQRWP